MTDPPPAATAAEPPERPATGNRPQAGPAVDRGRPPWARHDPPWAESRRRSRYRGPWPRRSKPPVFVLSFLLVFVQIVGSQHAQAGRTLLDPLAYGLLVAGPVALLFRRRYPLATALAVVAVTSAYLWQGYPFGPVVLSAVVALFQAASYSRRHWAWLLGAAGYATYVWRHHDDIGRVFTVAAGMCLVFAFAEMASKRRQWIDAARAARVETSRRQVSDERLAIARELHDVIAHNISLINVQAGVALHLMDAKPEQARTALTTIKQASKETLQELRATLGVLRRVDEDAPRSPTAGLDHLDTLVERVAGIGVTTTVERTGQTRPLPAAVDLAAYRIIQEALTNVYRHSGAKTATVRIDYGPREVTIDIEDEGHGRAPDASDGGGNGIPGMRERAAALGGKLVTGPRPDGGYQVSALLPVEDRP